MALLFMDSFDKYTVQSGAAVATEMQRFWTAGDNLEIKAGRTGNCVSLTSFGANLDGPTLSPTDNEGWAGFAFKTDGALGNDVFFAVREGSTIHIQLRQISASGLIEVQRGDGTVLGTGTFVTTGNIWTYIELHWIIDNSAGAWGIRFNGQSSDDVSGTSVDTQNGGTAAWDNVQLLAQATSTPDDDFDDLYVLDSASSGVTGALNNDYLGDIKIEARSVDGNGNTSGMTGSDADSTDNYLHMDDDPGPDDDSSYVEANPANTKDTYTTQDLSEIADDDIRAIQVSVVAKKTDAGLKSMRTVIRHSGTDYAGSTVALGTDYGGQTTIEEGSNPGGGSTQWTIASVNALEIGQEVI